MSSKSFSMTAEEYIDFDVETCTSVSEINSDEVDWRVTSVETYVGGYLRKESGVEDVEEVLSDDSDKDDENANVEERITTYEALTMIDQLINLKDLSSEHGTRFHKKNRGIMETDDDDPFLDEQSSLSSLVQEFQPEGIREYSLNVYNDFERDFYVIHLEEDIKTEVDYHNLQDLHPVEDSETLRLPERERRNTADRVNG
eukprot:gene5002-107_t